eukprot:3136175-Rhodomonas_salina.2
MRISGLLSRASVSICHDSDDAADEQDSEKEDDDKKNNNNDNDDPSHARVLCFRILSAISPDFLSFPPSLPLLLPPSHRSTWAGS